MDSEVDRNESDNVIEKNEKLADDSTGSDIILFVSRIFDVNRSSFDWNSTNNSCWL